MAKDRTILVVSAWTARDLDYWMERTGRTIGESDVERTAWVVASGPGMAVFGLLGYKPDLRMG